MKCALELQAIAKTKIEENHFAQEEAERKKRAEIANTTFEYCEKIGEKLEEKAMQGKNPEVRFYFKYNWGSKTCGSAMASTNTEYADRRTSHYRVGKDFDLEIMKMWFDRYCFEVEWKDSAVWCYGAGCCRAYWVTIKPVPECK